MLRVWGVLIPTNAWQGMVGVISSGRVSSIYSVGDGLCSFASSSS